ncbi:regulator RcnB of Ni and Co efflux [Sphingomonas palmae]|uniref:Regulator RcnB of Ni and Co efflux n=1 Tax=Sphingomonas palmae TaxID=1855283 RepID=A0A1H7TUQ6_9SPHN|nr:RcnB family protein [Sphingomonas palmae]SEL88600.1 regulator RcnB of Ni and Co efflux [Sphingomonas palmae]
MIRSLVAGLLAAAAGIVPGVASAQDGSVRDMMRARMQARVEAQGRPERPTGAERSGDRGGWQRPDRPEGAARGEWRRDDRGPRADGGPRPDRGGERAVVPAPTRDWNRDARDGAQRPDRGQGWSRGDRGDAPGRPQLEDRRFEDQRGDRLGPDARRPNGDWRGRDDTQRGWGDRGPTGRDWRAGTDWRARSDWNDRRGIAGRDGRVSGWGGASSRGWDRGWRQQRRYDWSGYRSSNRGAYRLPRYYAPYGWNRGYQRFGIGARLSPVLFAQSYWIDDPFAYRLPEPYGPYRWVRYYNDAVLVDVYTGEVVDTIYDIFW